MAERTGDRRKGTYTVTREQLWQDAEKALGKADGSRWGWRERLIGLSVCQYLIENHDK